MTYLPQHSSRFVRSLLNPTCPLKILLVLTLFAVTSGFFYSPWEDLHLATWAATTFTTSNNMSVEVGQPVAAASTTQVKLCPYDEEEPAVWFYLIKAQFATAGIKSQQLKYANALANLPKQVL
jgi:hypothetical protein